MMTNGYEKEVSVKYSEMDFDKSLKAYTLLNYFQDIASDNAEEWGFGYSYITPKNLMWVLLKYRIEFNEYPVGIHNLLLKTEPRGYNKLFAYRDFELYSEKTLLARATTAWTLVDFTNMSVVLPEKVIDNPYMKKFEPCEDDLHYEKIPVVTKADIEKDFEVRYNDLDVNRHANNGNYIVWALEPLDINFRANHRLKTVDLIYKKEAKYGDKLITQVQFLSENHTIHAVKNATTNEDLCLVQCKWN